jgi:hypothetical protein
MGTLLAAALGKPDRLFETNLTRKMTLGPTSVSFVTVALVTVLSLLYLTQANQASTKSYQIGELQARKEILLKEQQQLQVEASRLQSIQAIQAGVGTLNMVPTRNTQSISVN